MSKSGPMQLRVGQLQPTARPHSLLRRSPEGLECIHVYGGGGILNELEAVIYKQYIMLKVWLNDEIVGCTKLGKTQQFACAVSGVMSHSV